YESIDYTPRKTYEADSEPRPLGTRGVVVKAFLAHHQGMSLVSFANTVMQDPMVGRFHPDARVQATQPLLPVRLPRPAPLHEPRQIEVTRYAEPVLGLAADDLAHPAFGKLFLETEYVPHSAALLCRRRPRAAEEPNLFAVHVLSMEGRMQGPVEWESDRARFL